MSILQDGGSEHLHDPNILSSLHDHQLIPAARDGNSLRHNVMRIARQVLPHHLQRHPSFLQKSFLLGFFPFYHRHTTVSLSTSVPVSFNFFQVSSWRAALTSCFRKAPSISSTLLPPLPGFLVWSTFDTTFQSVYWKKNINHFKCQDETSLFSSWSSLAWRRRRGWRKTECMSEAR